MRVEKISLLNFRNYQRLELNFNFPRVLILGRNGQGKTNLVEGICYFDSLKSHRVSSDAPLLLTDTDYAVTKLTVAHNAVNPTLELQFRSKQPKKAFINANPVPPRELTRWFTAVIFAPEDLQIVKGDPYVRRNFLDDAIVTKNPYFASVFKEYERIVKQRSALLKSLRGGYHIPENRQALEFWNRQLVDVGTRIIAERRALLDLLQPHLTTTYANLVLADHSPQLEMRESIYRRVKWNYYPLTNPYEKTKDLDVSRETSKIHLTELARKTLIADFENEINRLAIEEFNRGMTLVGPHRDDLELSLKNLPVKGYASQGESWSMTLSLKLALAEILKNELHGEDPVLILDDVFAELDSVRRERLLAAIADYEQVIVTSAVAADIIGSENWQIYIINAGKIVATGTSDNPEKFFSDHITAGNDPHGK